jgi:hypothetical protein
VAETYAEGVTRAWELLWERIEADDIKALSYEEVEAIADAVFAGTTEGAPLSRHNADIAREILKLYAALLVAEPGVKFTAADVADALTDRGFGPPQEATQMELEREIERRKKYGPRRAD